jgi:hypothetical protein
MLKAVRSVSSVDAVTCLNSAIAQVQLPLFPKETINIINELSSIAKPLLEKKNRIELRLSSLLQSGREIIEEEQLSSCPLCQQPIDRISILETLRKRTDDLQALTEEAAKVRTLATSLNTIIRDVEAKVATLRSVTEKVPDVKLLSLEGINSLPVFVSWPNQINEVMQLHTPLSIEEFQQTITQTEEHLQQVVKEIEAEIERLGVTDKEKVLLEMVRLVGSVKEKVNNLSDIESRKEHLEAMLSSAENIYETFLSVSVTVEQSREKS